MSAPGYGSVPAPTDSQLNRGYGAQDFAPGHGNAAMSQSMPQPADLRDDYGGNRNSYITNSSIEGGSAGLNRASSAASTSVPTQTLSRSGSTLKKRGSVRRTGSLKRSSSRKSVNAGGLAAFGGADGGNQEFNSFSHTPVPTSGAPTEILANRFQAWRQLLKSLITYFREIQASYDARQKAIHKVQNTVANISHPSVFMSENGLRDATRILDDYHKRSIAEANKSREIEDDVIGALTGLRSDLGQKIKEIKSLSGDFKNSVEKEKDATRKAVEQFQDALQHADHDDGSAMGKNDPFVVRLGVDRMIEKQIDEENYLHRAYLNLESSGRELESIVVGEIQKAYNALAGILKREGDDAYHAVETLRAGPIAMPKDAEWDQFVTQDAHFVDPRMPIRRIEQITYPGKNHPAAAEIRAGMLERKSKYLKSYTPGWYVLSPTHLHEFKSADKIYSQPPVMSLYLPDQRLGSRSQEDSTSHKFMLKGKQSGGMHKGHNWVFRAESFDTMSAWYSDIQALTEATGEERNAFIRKHARTLSAGQSDGATISSDGMEEDEADAVPYAADAASLSAQNQVVADRTKRPQPGGRFPSDLRLPKSGAMVPPGPDSEDDDEAAVMGGAVADAAVISPTRQDYYGSDDPYRLDGVSAGTRTVSGYSQPSGVDGSYIDDGSFPPGTERAPTGQPPATHQPPPAQQESFLGGELADPSVPDPLVRNNSDYGDWLAPAAATAAGAAGAGGLLGTVAFKHHAHDPQHAEGEGEVSATAMPDSRPESVPGVNPASVSDASQSEVISKGHLGSSSDIMPTRASTSNTTASGTTLAASTPESSIGAAGDGHLHGNEREGANETGVFLPKVIRHNTSLSVSKLHVPGEFPGKT